MAKCHQNILTILALIYKKTGTEFLLRYLHPEYSMIDYRFENFDLNHLDKMIVIANPLDSKNKRSNQKRYIRIAFDSLEDFLAKENRKNYILINENSTELNPIVNAIAKRNFELADKELKDLLQYISLRIYDLEDGITKYAIGDINEYPKMVAEDEPEQ